MGAFLDWFFAFLTTMIDGIWKIISGLFTGIVQIFNIVEYVKQFSAYKDSFSVLDWILAILSFLMVTAIWVIIIYIFVYFYFYCIIRNITNYYFCLCAPFFIFKIWCKSKF